MMSTALNKTATKRWDPANIRPLPPQSEPLLVDFSQELDAQSGEIVSACQDAKDAEASVEAKCAAVNESAYFNKPKTIGTRPRTPTIPPSALPVCVSTYVCMHKLTASGRYVCKSVKSGGEVSHSQA